MEAFMSKTIKWTKNELLTLYKLHYEDGETFEEIADKLEGRSAASIKRKFGRVDWDAFAANPDAWLDDQTGVRSWKHSELVQLDAYLQCGKSYGFIAQHMNRSVISIERKAQETDWNAWRAAMIEDIDDELGEEARDALISQLVDAMTSLSRHDYVRLNGITQDEFMRKINFDDKSLPVPFTELKDLTKKRLDDEGLGNPETIELGEGTYVIVGDSHGKHTKTKVFDLLKQFVRFIKADAVIHVGHILDDDNDISYLWGNIKNLTILAKEDELRIVQQQRNKFKFSYNIVRGCITMGDLVIMNQELISDYVKTPIRNLDSEIFDSQVVVNCHRLETASKASESDNPFYIASPGSLCEQHIVKTIKQIDFTDNRTVKLAFHGGFAKYRRMKHMCKYWNQGLIVIHVDANGNHTIVPCLIQKVSGDYATSYFDRIVTSTGVYKPTKKIFVTCDAHCPMHNPDILDIQEQICLDYGADVLVNLGDVHNYSSLNHHEMDRGKILFGDLLQESAEVFHLLRNMKEWAPECHLIVGNHERFCRDFVDKYPQLASCLDLEFLCALKSLDYKITDLKDVLKIGSAKFIHGDMRFYGQNGTKLEKASRALGHNVFVGHVHYPSIRFGCYSAGFSGQFDQEYNEPNASQWIHGFGMCNQYRGKSWSTSIAIMGNHCVINGKTYFPKNASKWKIKNFNATICYETE